MNRTVIAAALGLALALGVGPIDRSGLTGQENACPGLQNAFVASEGRVLKGAAKANEHSAVALCLADELLAAEAV